MRHSLLDVFEPSRPQEHVFSLWITCRSHYTYHQRRGLEEHLCLGGHHLHTNCRTCTQRSLANSAFFLTGCATRHGVYRTRNDRTFPRVQKV